MTPPSSNSPTCDTNNFSSNMTSSATQTRSSRRNSTSSKLYYCDCNYCDVTFGDDAMHALHTSCHDPQDPFKCKICGEQCDEKYNFNEHIWKGMHNRNESEDKKNIFRFRNSHGCNYTEKR